MLKLEYVLPLPPRSPPNYYEPPQPHTKGEGEGGDITAELQVSYHTAALCGENLLFKPNCGWAWGRQILNSRILKGQYLCKSESSIERNHNTQHLKIFKRGQICQDRPILMADYYEKIK
jgi:hypothetical protein